MACYYDSFRVRLILCLVLIGSTTVVLGGSTSCPEDFAPCKCSSSSQTGLTVKCDRVPLTQVRQVLHRTRAVEFNHLGLTPKALDDKDPSGNELIPSGFLKDKRVRNLYIYCPVPTYKLRVDQNALESTGSHTDYIYISGCDLSQLDFAFLADFKALSSLDIYSSTHIHETILTTLPDLPSLRLLNFYHCAFIDDESEELTGQGSRLTGLERLDLSSSDLTDNQVARILFWIRTSESIHSLSEIVLARNALTEVPDQLEAFKNLTVLDLYDNEIPIIRTGSLAFSSAPVDRVDLRRCGLSVIEPGAFQGDFTNAYVFLEDNLLERLERPVFESIFQQALQSGREEEDLARIGLENNPIDCQSDPCHLAWIIRDRRDLLQVIEYGAFCSNGTLLSEVDPTALSECHPLPDHHHRLTPSAGIEALPTPPTSSGSLSRSTFHCGTAYSALGCWIVTILMSLMLIETA